MAELSNWLGDLWESTPEGEEQVYDWADDEVLETAFSKAAPAKALPDDLAGVLTHALGSKPTARSAPAAMAELSAAARRPDQPARESDPEPAVPAPSEPEVIVPAVLSWSGRSRAEDDILPTRRPQGGRLVALRMAFRKR
ncbi:MAG: hypothetical protein JWO37_2325 [Acidimicrobiales bacterium]|jgi:hypothetical protein|nr:hypothetical protein [Acidimicrobiales bacterium]